MTGVIHLDDLLTNEQAAALLGIKPKTLEIWRIKGKSPPFLKLGRAKQAPIRYQRSDILIWLKKRSFASTSAYATSRNSPDSEKAGRAGALSEITTYTRGGAARD